MTRTLPEVLEKGVASWLRPHAEHGARRGALDYLSPTDPPTSLSTDFQLILSSLGAAGWAPEGHEEVGDDVIQQYVCDGEDRMLVVLLDGRLRCINMAVLSEYADRGARLPFMYFGVGHGQAGHGQKAVAPVREAAAAASTRIWLCLRHVDEGGLQYHEIAHGTEEHAMEAMLQELDQFVVHHGGAMSEDARASARSTAERWKFVRCVLERCDEESLWWISSLHSKEQRVAEGEFLWHGVSPSAIGEETAIEEEESDGTRDRSQ